MTDRTSRAVAPVSAVCAAFRAQPSAYPPEAAKPGRCADVRELYGNGRHRKKPPAGGFRRRKKPQAARQEKSLALFCASPSTSARSAGSFGR